MSVLKMSFFGPGQILLTPDKEAKIRSRKEFALLAYLALENDRAHNRGAILGLLWPELEEAQARNNLRVALARLRKVVDRSEPALIQADRHTLRFDSQQLLADGAAWMDVAEFNRLLAIVDSHDHANPTECPTCLADMVNAAELYQGEFLHGFHLGDCEAFDHWLLVQRERFHMQVMDLLPRLEYAHIAAQNWTAAETTVRKRLALDPLDEDAHRTLMQVLALSGLRNAALSHYELCIRTLDEELGVEPDEETVSLAEQIRTGDLTPSPSHPLTLPPPHPPTPSPPHLPDPYTILSRLEPLPDQTLFGVDKAVETVGSALNAVAHSWLISIEGIGGLGKTTLANTLVKEKVAGWQGGKVVESQEVTYQDIAWVSAKQEEYLPDRGIQSTGKPALDEESLMDQLLAQLADGPYPTGSSQEKRLALTKLLKEKTCLVVVDNLETAIDYQALLPLMRHLANPSKFLITSRMSLTGQGDVFAYSLSELDEEDALAFLRHEAETRGMVALAAASDEQLCSIYATVGGNPLALKLVLGQLQFLPLDPILTSLRTADSEHSEQLYTYIYWQAWQMLDATSRHLLLCLPVVPNATFAQLQNVSGLDGDALQPAIMRLRDLSLVEIGGDLTETRYRLHRLTETFLMHEVVKWQEAGWQGGEVASVQRTEETEYFMQRVLYMVAQWNADEAVSDINVETLDEEYESIVKAISLGLELDSGWDLVKQLILAFTPFMERRGHWPIWHGILERSICNAQNLKDIDSEVTLTSLLARLCQRSNRPKDVIFYYKRVIRLARFNGNLFEEARACSNLGFAYIDGGLWWRSEVLSHHALKIFEKIKSHHGLAHTHNHLGLLYIRCHQWQDAESRLKKACDLWNKMGDTFNLTQGYSNLGSLYLELEEPQQALKWLEKSIYHAKLSGDEVNIGTPLMNLGLAYYQAGEFKQAENHLKQAEDVHRRFANSTNLAQVWGNLGEFYLTTKIWDKSKKYLNAARDVYQELGNWEGEIKALLGLIKYAFAQENYPESKAHITDIEVLIGIHDQIKQTDIMEQLLAYRTRLANL